MSQKKLAELRQKRESIAIQMRGLNESIGDNNWTDDNKSEWRNMKNSLQSVEHQIEVEEEMRRLTDEEAARQAQNEDKEKRKRDNKDPDGMTYRSVFDKMIRNGFNELTRDERNFIKQEQRALAEGTDTTGGFTVPVEFQDRIIEMKKAYGGIANNCQNLVTSNGRVMQWATCDGTAEIGEFVGENQKAGQEDPSFGSAELGAKKISSKTILVSNELLQDTGVSLDSFLGRKIAMRIGRKEADAIVNGTGSGLENKGLSLQVTNTVAAAAAAKVDWKDVNNLKHSIDIAYRQMNSFKLAFNDKTLQVLEEQEDGQGRPLWLPSVAGVTPSTILGIPYFIDQAIDDIGSGKKCMYAGDWNAFILRRVKYMQLRRLVELYAESDQTGFLAFHRFDTLLEDTSAIKALTGA
ncbi:TPA: phage major capsid protein [Photobacterium damselae]